MGIEFVYYMVIENYLAKHHTPETPNKIIIRKVEPIDSNLGNLFDACA